MSEVLVTIITPTYNHEMYIGRCIESVISQTYSNWELIIIDDGSTDKTAEIIAQYSDSRIKYIHQNNVGIWKLKETYNKGLRIAQGELIAILEGDDFWPPDKLDKQIASFECKDTVLSCGKASQVNHNGFVIDIANKNINLPDLLTGEFALRELLLGNNFISACTVMCRKEALEIIGGFQQANYTPFVDYPTWLELCLYGNVIILDDTMGYWRRHEQQITNQLPLDMANAGKYSIDFFLGLSENCQKSLGINLSTLKYNYNLRLGWGWIFSGRNALIQKDWKQARSDFYNAFNTGPIYIKIIAIGGGVCSWCKIDAEWIAKIFSKRSLKD